MSELNTVLVIEDASPLKSVISPMVSLTYELLGDRGFLHLTSEDKTVVVQLSKIISMNEI